MGSFKHPQPYHLISISNVCTSIHTKSTGLRDIQKDLDFCLQDQGAMKADSERTVGCMWTFCLSYSFFSLRHTNWLQNKNTCNQNQPNTEQDKCTPFPWPWLRNRTLFFSWTSNFLEHTVPRKMVHWTWSKEPCGEGPPGTDTPGMSSVQTEPEADQQSCLQNSQTRAIWGL